MLSKNPGGWYTPYTRVYPPNTPLHVWYVDAGIKDTPEPVYTPCLVYKACCHRRSLRLDIRRCGAVCLKHDETDLQNGRSRIPLS